MGVRRRRELRLLIQNSVTVMMGKGAGHARDAAGIAVNGGTTLPRIVELLATGQVPVARSLLQARECMGCRRGEEPLHRHAAWQGF